VAGQEGPSLALREVGVGEGAKRLLVPAFARVGAEEDGVLRQEIEVRRLVGARRGGMKRVERRGGGRLRGRVSARRRGEGARSHGERERDERGARTSTVHSSW